jgi:drug/metabolite transporter (DMT)-like permease
MAALARGGGPGVVALLFVPEKVQLTLMEQFKRLIARLPLGVVFSLFALYIIWGSTYLVIRFALIGFPPFLMAAIRFLIAGGSLYGFLRWRGAPSPTRAQWIGAGLVGLLLLAGGNGGVTFAEQWVSSGLAAVWVATMPIWAALFSGLWGKWPNRIEWAGLLLGFIGVGLLNLEGNLRANPLGAIALTIATVCWALGSVWSRYLTLPTGPMSSAAQMLAGSASLFILSLISGERLTAMPGAQSLLAVLYLVVFGSLIAFSAYGYLLRHTRPTLATSYAYVNPAVAVFLGVWLGGESITGIGVFAMVVILGGVALVAAGRGK